MNEKTIENLLNLLEECGPHSRISFGQDPKYLLQRQFAEHCDKIRRKKRLKYDWNLLPLDVRQEYEEPVFTVLETRLLNFLEEKQSILPKIETNANECRFCLLANLNDLVSLSELNEGLLDVAQNFFQVSMFDGFPQHICLTCLSMLKSILKFYENCTSSKLKLLALALKEVCPRTIDVNLEETSDLLLLSNVSEAKSQMEEYSVVEHDRLSNSDHDAGNAVEIYDNRISKSHVTDIIVKKHICEYCSKSFKTKLSLKVHVRSHTNERPFICQECGKSFKTYSAVNNHRAAHSTDKKFKCPEPECNYKTTTKANLNIHGRTHSQERFVFVSCYLFKIKVN